MRFLEQVLTRVLQGLGLVTVKRRILTLALLATLIPSVTTGWLLYSQNRSALTGKLHEELRSASISVSREFDLWLKERVYELRVFSSSYELSENVEKALRGGRVREQVLRRARQYLNSVHGKFSDYEDLFVIDTGGNVVATNTGRPVPVTLPRDWQKQAKLDQPILTDARWDEARGKRVMTVAVPLKSVNGRLLGVLAATLNFGTMEAVLRQWAQGQTRHLYVVAPDGTRILSSLLSPQAILTTKLPEHAARAFFDREPGELVQVKYEDLEVLGVLQRIPRLEWSVVAEKNYEDAYRALLSIRNVALVFTAWLLLSVGLIAYLLSLSIVGPLTRLSEAADKVSGGDLNIEIETDARGEIGALAATFNTMVTNLRWAQQELTAANLSLNERNKTLEVLSATDALTGLHNRRHMMETLSAEVTRHQRYKRRFSVMMLDVDHFKRYNDNYGHPAGDALLKKVAGIVKSSLRANDFAARYGGEEFLILLPDQDQPGAVEVAERIRQRIAAETEDQANKRQAVTISIGIATFPEGGQGVEPLLANADAALYRAKNAGRNRVVTVSA